jgi:hypothetical protein
MRTIRKFTSALAIAAGLSAMGACSWGPGAAVTSLSPAIKGAAVADNQLLADASDEILILNILRARDGAALDMGTLSSLSATLTLQGTAGFTIPFGSAPAMPTGNTFSPSITGSTSPTYTFTPLNTQGFALMALQPISPSYVERRWQSGLSLEMLLRLFIKEIDFPVPADSSNPYSTHLWRYINNPDRPAQYKAFEELVQKLVANHAAFRTFDVLDPAGPAVSLVSPLNPSSPQDYEKNLISPNSTAFALVTGNSDGQYHFGNAGVGSDAQLYRVYAGQVALCVDDGVFTDYRLPRIYYPSDVQRYPLPQLPPAPAPGAPKPGAKPKLGAENYALALGKGGGGSPNGGNSNTNTTINSASGSGPKGSGSPGNANSATSSQATTAPLQAPRVSAIVNSSDCGPAEIVFNHMTENAFEDHSAEFVQIQWRSLTEVFEYLGAVLRNRPLEHAWTEQSDQWVAEDTSTIPSADERAANAARRQPSCPVAYLFNLSHPAPAQSDPREKNNSYVSVVYRGDYYSVASDWTGCNHSMQVLTMLTTLVDLANASTNVTTSQPLQLLTLP